MIVGVETKKLRCVQEPTPILQVAGARLVQLA